jgi:hypothetical protein
MEPVVAWLAERPPEELARLIAVHPYALGYGPKPRTLRDLASRLLAPYNLVAFDDVPLPQLQVVLAAAALAGGTGAGHGRPVVEVDQEELLTALGACDGSRRTAALAVIERLRARFLLVAARPGRVAAHGALTEPGRALAAAGDLETVLTRLLPPPQEKAHFPGDLTAVVPGAPAAELADLLSAAADRESDGHAVVRRFTPASVRRALDAGRDAEELLAALADAALAPPWSNALRENAPRCPGGKTVPAGTALRRPRPP